MTIATSPQARPAGSTRGRRMAVTGLILFLPLFGLLILFMAGAQMNHDYCYDQGCTKPLMTAIAWSWWLMGSAGGIGLIAALLPNRYENARFTLACVQIVLMATPFALVTVT
ncbi:MULTISPECIES: hypothetical protein [Streptomyces]